MVNNNISEAEKKKLAAEKKAKLEKIEADKLAAEKKAKESEVKTYKVKEAKDLGFEKRNFFIGTKNYLLVAGAEVDQETFDQFNAKAQKIFFEE